jgi:hypothetical protein
MVVARPQKFRMIAGICLLTAALGACEPSRHVVFTSLSEAGGGAGESGTGAGSGGSGSGGSSGSGGVVERPAADPFLNPSVHFLWKETVPGAGGCQPGTYVGRFECRPGSGPLFPVEGNLRFTLAGSEETQLLTIEEGEVSGFSSMLTGELLRGDLTGSLDCLSDVFDAQTEGGEVFAAPFSSLFPVLRGGAFAGTLDGAIDKATSNIRGTWKMSGSLTCTGDFEAALSL